MSYKDHSNYIICSVCFFFCLLLESGCSEQKVSITVNVQKEDGNTVSDFSIGWEEGKPTGADFWETAIQTSRNSDRIHPGPPYRFEKKTGDACILDVETPEDEITIFVETEDEYYGRAVLKKLSSNKALSITITCVLHGDELAKNKPRPDIQVTEIEKGILVTLKDLPNDRRISTYLLNGRVTETNSILDGPILREGVNKHSNDTFIDTHLLPEGVYSIGILVHPKKPEGLWVPDSYIEYYTVKGIQEQGADKNS